MFSKAIIASILALTASVNARVALVARTPDGVGVSGNCSPQSAGSGAVTNNPDTAAAFLANPVYANTAKQASVPNGASLTSQNLQAAVINNPAYLGVDYLQTYDTAYCTQRCLQWSGCKAFNIYFERDPTLDAGSNCPNPSSTTTIKCAYYSAALDPASATNSGQVRWQFQVAIAGSNIYGVSAQSSSTTTTAAATTTTASTSTTTTTTTTTTLAGPFTACPSPVSYIVSGPARAVYAVCLNTDFQISSTYIQSSVADNRACANLCDQQSGCTQATYNQAWQTCYLKGNAGVAQSNWQPNSGFQTLVRVPDGTSITSCPNSYAIYENGVWWTACPGTNFHNNPATNIWSSGSEYDCAAKCEATQGCGKFVFDWNNNICYNKGNPALANTQWTIQAGLGSYYTS